jgi:hypothetical protein
MKTLITSLALATLIAVPAFAQSTRQQTNRASQPRQGYGPTFTPTMPDASRRTSRAGRTGQSYDGTYKGYPLSEWYRPDLE